MYGKHFPKFGDSKSLSGPAQMIHLLYRFYQPTPEELLHDKIKLI